MRNNEPVRYRNVIKQKKVERIKIFILVQHTKIKRRKQETKV